jgi:hypothetical protein
MARFYWPFFYLLITVLVGVGDLLSSRQIVADDAWMVLVTQRVLSGEVLYRDVFCGVTPLAFQAYAWMASLFGNSLFVLRAYNHLLYVAVLVATIGVGERLAIPRRWMHCALGSIVLWSLPVYDSIYSTLAVLWSVVAFGCAVGLTQSLRSPIALSFVGGLACGLAFASKQNVGLLSMVAFGSTVLWFLRGRLVAGGGALVAGFVFGAVPPLLPTLLAGAGPWLLAQGFVNKSVYLSKAGQSYAQYLNLTPVGEFATHGILYGWLEWFRSLGYVLPFALVLGVVAWLRRAEDRGMILVVFAFAGASLMAIYPRPDPSHLVMAIPATGLAVAYFCGLLFRGSVASGLCLAGVLLAMGAQLSWLSTREDGQGSHRPSDRIREAAHGQPLFLLVGDAPLWYLGSGVTNPTRFDYPLASTFGRDGQAEVIESIRNGRVQRVCLQKSDDWQGLPPTELLAFVRTRMQPGEDAGPCRIFERMAP